MVHLERHESTITLSMGLEEAERISAALTEATLVLSRAEYWIRVGCPKSSVEQLSDLLRRASRGEVRGVSVAVPPGEEEQENPRRPRAGSDSAARRDASPG